MPLRAEASTVLALLAMMALVAAEGASPGVVKDTARAVAIVLWAVGEHLPARLGQATAMLAGIKD